MRREHTTVRHLRQPSDAKMSHIGVHSNGALQALLIHPSPTFLHRHARLGWAPWGTDIVRLGSRRTGRQPPGWNDDAMSQRALELLQRHIDDGSRTSGIERYAP